MKKTLIALMALAGVAMADVSLSTQVQKSDGTAIDIYNQWETYKADKSIVEGTDCKNATTLTFYVKVSDLFGAVDLDADASYQLTSFSYLGWDDDGELGNGETLTVTLGNQSVTGVITDKHATGSYNPQNTVTFAADQVLTFTSADILVVTLSGTGSGDKVGIRYMDSPKTNKVLGTASTLRADGNLNYYHVYSDHGANSFQSGWKTDAPIINLTAAVVAATPETPAVPEPATATLSLLALAGLASRRRRK